MKNIITVFLSAVAVVALAGCSAHHTHTVSAPKKVSSQQSAKAENQSLIAAETNNPPLTSNAPSLADYSLKGYKK